jgi:hypothetical protein
MSALWYLLTSHIAGGCYGTYTVHEFCLIRSNPVCLVYAERVLPFGRLLRPCFIVLLLNVSLAHCPGRKVCVILHSIGSSPVCGRATN